MTVIWNHRPEALIDWPIVLSAPAHTPSTTLRQPGLFDDTYTEPCSQCGRHQSLGPPDFACTNPHCAWSRVLTEPDPWQPASKNFSGRILSRDAAPGRA